MRRLIAPIVACFLLFPVSACDDSHEYAYEDHADRVEEGVENWEEEVEASREVIEERLREAEERIREELDSYDEEDLVSREELEKLRARIEASADRLQEDLQHADRNVEASLRDLGEALEQIGAALQDDSDIVPVDQGKLRDLLPREVAGMERYDSDGTTNNVLGIRISKVEARYDGGAGDMSIAIIDLGSLSGAAAIGLDMLDSRIEAEFNDDLERTTRFDGYPAYVTYEEKGNRVKRVAVIRVTERFVVAIEAEGRDLSDDVIEEAVDRISLRRLARLGRR